jgi:hypothetical protein
MREKQWIVWLWAEDCISNENAEMFFMTLAPSPPIRRWVSNLEQAGLFDKDEAYGYISDMAGFRTHMDIHPRFRYA